MPKCSFRVMYVAYLGHIIFADGVTIDADKVAAVAAWPAPPEVHLGVRPQCGAPNTPLAP